MLRRILGSGNRRARIFVGLLLVGLFCLQCIGPGGDHTVVQIAQAIGDQETPEQAAAKARKLAATDHVALLEYCLSHYQKRSGDFRCTFVKQERIGGKIGAEQEVAVKFRRTPFSVAMAWTNNPPQGDRVLFLEGKYDNQMLIRPTNKLAQALAPTVLRPVDGDEARRNALRTVNQFGFERSLQSLIDVYKQARALGDSKEELQADSDVLGRRTYTLVRYLPEGKDYPAYETRIYVDQETLLPIMVEGCGPRGMQLDFLCRYLYKDVDFKVNWKDEDFLPEKNDLVTPKP